MSGVGSRVLGSGFRVCFSDFSVEGVVCSRYYCHLAVRVGLYEKSLRVQGTSGSL